MLACTRSLMNRASRSSTNSLGPHHLQQRGQRHLRRRVLARRGRARRTPPRPSAGRCSRIAATSAGLSIGTPGHVPVRRSPRPERPAAGGQLDDLADQRLARAAALAGAGRVHHPGHAACAAGDAGRRCALGDAVAVADLHRRRPSPRRPALRGPAPRSNSSSDALLGQRQPAVEALGQERDLVDVAEQGRADQLAVAHHHATCRPRARGSEKTTNSSSSRSGPDAHRGDVDAGHLELRRVREPW